MASGYGSHLVYVHRRSQGRTPELQEVRDAVKREWLSARRAASKDEFYEGLRQRYKIVIEKPQVDKDALTPDSAS